MATLSERLARGDVVIMDGGVSTEIQKQGGTMDARVWSGAAHMEHPDITRRVHESYIRAGAEVITANTYATSRHVLEGRGWGKRFEEINRRAVEIAREACDKFADRELWIAASISSTPPFGGSKFSATGPHVLQNYRDQAAMDAHRAGGRFADYKRAFAMRGVEPTGPVARVPSSSEMIAAHKLKLSNRRAATAG